MVLGNEILVWNTAYEHSFARMAKWYCEKCPVTKRFRGFAAFSQNLKVFFDSGFLPISTIAFGPHVRIAGGDSTELRLAFFLAHLGMCAAPRVRPKLVREYG